MFDFQKIYIILLVLSITIMDVECKFKKNEVEDKQQEPEQSKPKITKGPGISAWGLVFLIVTLILLGVAAYYIALFYPVLCKKERKYNRIELATV